VKKSFATGRCGSAACCAESLRFSGKRLIPKSLILSLRQSRDFFTPSDGWVGLFSCPAVHGSYAELFRR
jgi:hypothetical protein